MKNILNRYNLEPIFKRRSSYPDGKHYIDLTGLDKELNTIINEELKKELTMKPTDRIREIFEETKRKYPEIHRNMSDIQRLDLTLVSITTYLDEQYEKFKD